MKRRYTTSLNMSTCKWCGKEVKWNEVQCSFNSKEIFCSKRCWFESKNSYVGETKEERDKRMVEYYNKKKLNDNKK